eukprot:gene4947-5461_t
MLQELERISWRKVRWSSSEHRNSTASQALLLFLLSQLVIDGKLGGKKAVGTMVALLASVKNLGSRLESGFE